MASSSPAATRLACRLLLSGAFLGCSAAALSPEGGSAVCRGGPGAACGGDAEGAFLQVRPAGVDGDEEPMMLASLDSEAEAGASLAGAVSDPKTPTGGGSALDFMWLKKSRDSACETIFLTDVLGTRHDPQGKIRSPPTFKYFERYYRSILALPGSRGKAVILHDFLSDEVTSNYTTKDGSISFVKVDISGMDPKMGLNDLRYQLFQDQVEKHPEWDTIFMTDISDVIAVHNPCMLVENQPEKIYLGSQTAYMKPYAYIHTKFQELGGKYLKWYEAQPNSTYALLNAGIMGGKREMVLKGLHKLNEVLLDPNVATRKAGEEITVNMPAFNYVFRRYFNDDIFTGAPLHSKFWNYQNVTDVFFWHK